MSGVEQFVTNNFSIHESAFDSCLNLIVYSYTLLAKEQAYSREAILNDTTKVRGKKAVKIELEDYLRHDLVSRYINPNRKLFELDWYLFQSGAEDFNQNIKTGILDIKVCSPLFNGNVYYIFECKRLNHSILDGYIKEGVMRFTSGQYYPNGEINLAGMISFLESTEIKHKIECDAAYNTINAILTKHEQDVMMKGILRKHKLTCPDYNDVDNYSYVFVSTHARKSCANNISIFHIVLDYNHLVSV